MKLIQKILLFALIILLPLSFESCSKFAQSKRQEEKRRKDLVKEKAEREREAERAYEEAIQRHYDMQQKSTQKMMRRTARKSYRQSTGKKEFFLVRWFTPKQKKVKSNRNEK